MGLLSLWTQTATPKKSIDNYLTKQATTINSRTKIAKQQNGQPTNTKVQKQKITF